MKSDVRRIRQHPRVLEAMRAAMKAGRNNESILIVNIDDFAPREVRAAYDTLIETVVAETTLDVEGQAQERIEADAREMRSEAIPLARRLLTGLLDNDKTEMSLAIIELRQLLGMDDSASDTRLKGILDGEGYRPPVPAEAASDV